MKIILAAAAAVVFMTGAAMADPIQGNWKTESGETATIASCSGGYCITLKSGKFAGKRIGQFKADGGAKYSGRITDPADDKTYKGSATVSGKSMKMQGCVMAVFCKTQTWTKL